MAEGIKTYLVVLATFLGIDMVWLGLVAKKFYAEQIGFLMKTEVNWTAAIIFYLLFVGGLTWFVVSPALRGGSWQRALLPGMAFGLITYATYDLTNLATVKDWPLLVTIVDLVWGTFLAGAVSTIAYLVLSKPN